MKKQQPPGERILRQCKRSAFTKHFLSHFHLEKIANDYFLLWHEAETEEEKKEVRKEYEKQVKLAVLMPFGVHAGEAALIHTMLTSNPMMNVGYVMLTILVWTLIRRLL
jgi:hypothetical protein